MSKGKKTIRVSSTTTEPATWEAVRAGWERARRKGWEALVEAAAVGAMLLELKRTLSPGTFHEKCAEVKGETKDRARRWAQHLMQLHQNLPLLEQHKPDTETEARALIRAHVAPSKPKPTKTAAPKSALERVKRAKQREIERLQIRFERKLEEERSRAREEALAKQSDNHRRWATALKEKEEALERAGSQIHVLMTEREYRLVLGCLHPDRNPLPNAGKAFAIFKKLEPDLRSVGAADRKRLGWS